MSFWSKLFRPKPPYLHPVFGKMTFQRIAPNKSYWEGRALFPPAKAEIEVFVDGDESGVAPGALQFYEQVQERYQGVVAKFQPEIIRQLRELSDEPLPVDFASTCRPTSVSVPDTRLRTEWDIGMECVFDPNLRVTIEMEDWEKGMVVVDS
jgi:hypothetical protein